MSLGLSLAMTLGNPVLNGGGYQFANAEAAALVARFTAPPTNARKALIDALVGSIKTAGVWTKLDALWLIAAANSQAAQRNWIADQYNLTPVSAPTFTADRGYTPDGATSYVRTGFIPSVAVSPQFAQNSASFGFWSRTDSATISQNMGNQGNVILPRSGTAGVCRVNNGGTASSAPNASSIGFFSALRGDGTTERLRRNNAQVVSAAAASQGVGNSEFLLCGRNSINAGITLQTSVLQTAMGFIGSNLTDGESDALYAATLTYLQAVGAA